MFPSELPSSQQFSDMLSESLHRQYSFLNQSADRRRLPVSGVAIRFCSGYAGRIGGVSGLAALTGNCFISVEIRVSHSESVKFFSSETEAEKPVLKSTLWGLSWI